MEILMGIDSVLNDEKKSSTYKFALLTSILDYIIENPNEYPKNGFHNIPLIYLAKRWLYYYYPLMLYGDEGIKQGNTQIAFAKQFREFAKNEHDNRIPYFDPIAIVKIRDNIETNQLISENLVRLLISIRGRILEQPLQFIKIGGGNPFEGKKVGDLEIKESHFNLFGLMNSEISGVDATDYDKIRSISKSWKGEKSSMNWLDLEKQEICSIKMGHYTYHELSKFRFYIKDAILKRWIEFSVEKYLRKDGLATYELIKGLGLHQTRIGRDNQIIKKLRKIVVDNFEGLKCLYCDSDISEFELDHFIPWSKYPTNKFWNLFPVCKTCNGIKKDFMIELNSKLEMKIRIQLENWLKYFVNKSSEMSYYGGVEVNYVDMENLDEGITFFVDQLKEISEYLI